MPRKKLAVRRFTVHKQLSELFRIEILANSTNDDLNIEKFTGWWMEGAFTKRSVQFD